MGKMFGVYLIVFLSFVLVYPIAATVYYNASTNEFNQLRAQDVADSASRSAMKRMQLSSQVDVYGNISFSPDDIWKTYKKVFLTSYNMDSEYDDTAFDISAPAVLIATNNGYYYHMLDESGDYAFTQRIPYAYETTAGTYVADTFNGRNILTYNGGKLAIKGTESPVTDSDTTGIHSTKKIRKMLQTAMNQMVNASVARTSSSWWSGRLFYLPDSLSNDLLYPTVTFKGATIAVLIQGLDTLTGGNINTYTVGNAQLTGGSVVYCYVRLNDGSKFYTKNSLKDTTEYELKEVVYSYSAAARKGYYPLD